MKTRFLKTTILILLIAVALAVLYLYLNRYSILGKNIDRLAKNLLPRYMEVGDINFDLENNAITIENFRMLNPPGYRHGYFVKVPLVTCRYSQRSRESILKGVEVRDIDLIEPVIYLERLEGGEINLRHMDELLETQPKNEKGSDPGSKIMQFLVYLLSPVKRLEDLIEFKPLFNIRDGSLIFVDSYVYGDGYETSIQHINAQIVLDLQEDFRSINNIRSEGTGIVNGNEGEVLSWVTEYDPKVSQLTMSNTLTIQNVSFIHFHPYYDRFSPFIFKKGRASGRLIFNFDRGNIGSTNELRFSHLELEPKREGSFGDFWKVSIEDLYKYFVTESGELVFDFKIKGPMKHPKFYIGSKTKRALTEMTIGKIADEFLKKDGAGSQQEQRKSDIEKIVDILKNL